MLDQRHLAASAQGIGKMFTVVLVLSAIAITANIVLIGISIAPVVTSKRRRHGPGKSSDFEVDTSRVYSAYAFAPLVTIRASSGQNANIEWLATWVYRTGTESAINIAIVDTLKAAVPEAHYDAAELHRKVLNSLALFERDSVHVH